MARSQPYTVACDGGLIKSANQIDLLKSPGVARELRNFEVSIEGGYRRINGFSKFGGESAVQMYKNSLILRACMTEKPFLHKTAYTNVKTNFIYHDDFINIFLKILDKKGVFNIGGKSQSVYNFAKSNKKDVKKIYSKGEFPLKLDMNLRKIKRFMK